MSENKVALVEALSKLGLGTLLAGILAAVIWFNHSEQLLMNQVVDDSSNTQLRLFQDMEKNQEAYMKAFQKHAEAMEQTGKILERLARDSK